MTLQEFIEMLRAIEDGRPFSVGFHLQADREGGVTLQKIVDRLGAGATADFLEKALAAEAPRY